MTFDWRQVAEVTLYHRSHGLHWYRDGVVDAAAAAAEKAMESSQHLEREAAIDAVIDAVEREFKSHEFIGTVFDDPCDVWAA